MHSPSMLQKINEGAVLLAEQGKRKARSLASSFGRNYDLPVGLNGRVIPKRQRLAAGFYR